MFLKISKNLLENTRAEAEVCISIKKETVVQVLSCEKWLLKNITFWLRIAAPHKTFHP